MGVPFMHDAGSRGAALLVLALLAGCTENERPDDALDSIQAPELVRVTPAKEALAGAHVPTVDPATMHEAEIRKALASAPRCDFRYGASAKPVLAFAMPQSGETSAGVVKLNGHLVLLNGETSPDGGGQALVLRADPVRLAVVADAEEQVIERRKVRRREADVLFEVGEKLRVGYRGYLDCTTEPPTVSPRETSGR